MTRRPITIACFTLLALLSAYVACDLISKYSAINTIRRSGGAVEFADSLFSGPLADLRARSCTVTLLISNDDVDNYTNTILTALKRLGRIQEVTLKGSLRDDLNESDSVSVDEIRSVAPDATIIVRIH